MNFTWGTDLSEAMNDIRTRIDRVRGRLPEDADPPVVQKFDSNAAPIMGLGRREHRRHARPRRSCASWPRTSCRRASNACPGVAAVTVGGGLRRQIHVELSREKITALDLSVDRVVNVLRTENQNIPIGEVYQGDRSLLLRSQGQFQNLEQIAQPRRADQERRAGLPEGHRRGHRLDRGHPIGAAHQRPAGRAHAGDQAVRHQHGADRRGRARRDGAHQPRSARRQDVAARRQRQVHRALDQRRAGARDDRLGAGRPDHLPVPAQFPLDADRLHRRFRFRSSARSRCSTSAA